MSLKSDDSQALTPTDLVFILAIAGRIDAQSRIFAKQLDKDGSIYYAYAVCDSLSSSYSMFKYFLDLFFPNSTSDATHDLMMTPGGVAAIMLGSLFQVGFSVLATHFDSEKEDNYKKMIASAHPYFRDAMKALKNAYKGWRSLITAFGLLGGVDVNSLIIPVGAVLGILAALNRTLARYLVTEPRKLMMAANVELKKAIRENYEESRVYLDEIQGQNLATCIYAFIAAGLGGIIDGLYLYAGVLGLAVLASPLLFHMVVLSTFYAASCAIARLYEEYDYQLRLRITQTKCKLELTAKEAETVYAQWRALKRKADKSDDELMQLGLLGSDLDYLLGQFDEQRKVLYQQSTRGYFAAILLGLRNGLSIYGALACVLFLVNPILLMSGVAFPPALLVVCISFGLVFIAAGIIHALITDYQHLHSERAQAEPPELLVTLRHTIQRNEALDDGLPEEGMFRKALDEGMAIQASPQSTIQDGAEVVRSTVSGCGKGQKIISFLGFFLQQRDEQGHYHDTGLMRFFSVISSLVFGAAMGLRALARCFGRMPLGQEGGRLPEDRPEPVDFLPLAKDAMHNDKPAILAADFRLELIKKDKNPKGLPITKVSREPIQKFKSRNDSHFDSSRSLFGFFETKGHKEKSFLPHEENDASLIPDEFTSGRTILGLG